jgi:hypothetical protein
MYVFKEHIKSRLLPTTLDTFCEDKQGLIDDAQAMWRVRHKLFTATLFPTNHIPDATDMT